MRSNLYLIIGGIVGASLLAFLLGMIFTIMVVMPPGAPGPEMASVTPEPTTRPPVTGTRVQASPTPTTIALIISTPTPTQPPSTTPVPSITTAPGQRPTVAPSPTPTPRFPFYYEEGSMVPADNCFSQYLRGWVRDPYGVPIDGVTIRWERWGEYEFDISGDPQKYYQRGEWKFTYMPENPRISTDFVLQVVDSEDDPEPLSKPLLIHYADCFETGQITDIVFKRKW